MFYSYGLSNPCGTGTRCVFLSHWGYPGTLRRKVLMHPYEQCRDANTFTPHSAPPLQYNTSPLPSLSAPGFHLTRLKKKKGDLPTYNRSRGCPSSCRYVRREAHPHPLGSCPTCRCRCYCTATSRGSSPPQGPASSYPARLLQAEAPIPTVPLLRPTYRF